MARKEARRDVQSRLLEKLDKKREKLGMKVAEIEEQRQELVEQSEELTAGLEAVALELSSLDDAARPGTRERLEAQRERLLAQQERLQLKVELLETKAEAIRETMNSIVSDWDRGALSSLQARWGFPEPPAPPHPPAPPYYPSKQQEQERLKILQMVADGNITAEDAARLIEALDRSGGSSAASAARRPRLVRILVTDLETDRVRVNVALPLSLLRAALKQGSGGVARFGVEGIDLDASELEELLNSGIIGHLVDVVDEKDGERVEIIVE